MAADLSYLKSKGFVSGRKPSRMLFEEYNAEYLDTPTYIKPVYSIKQWHDTFLKCRDLTEWKACQELVGDWDEWCRLKRDFPDLADFIERWKVEVVVAIQSESMEKILSLVTTSSDQTAASCAKFILQKGWEKSEVGRPDKGELKKQAKELARIAADTDDEAKRIEKLLTRSDFLAVEEDATLQ